MEQLVLNPNSNSRRCISSHRCNHKFSRFKVRFRRSHKPKVSLRCRRKFQHQSNLNLSLMHMVIMDNLNLKHNLRGNPRLARLGIMDNHNSKLSRSRSKLSKIQPMFSRLNRLTKFSRLNQCRKHKHKRNLSRNLKQPRRRKLRKDRLTFSTPTQPTPIPTFRRGLSTTRKGEQIRPALCTSSLCPD